MLQKTSAQLKTKYSQLISLLEPITETPLLSSALTDQQVSWGKYRSNECQLIGSLSGAGGGWPSVYKTECDVNLTEARLRSVTSAIKRIEKLFVGRH